MCSRWLSSTPTRTSGRTSSLNYISSTYFSPGRTRRGSYGPNHRARGCAADYVCRPKLPNAFPSYFNYCAINFSISMQYLCKVANCSLNYGNISTAVFVIASVVNLAKSFANFIGREFTEACSRASVSAQSAISHAHRNTLCCSFSLLFERDIFTVSTSLLSRI